MSFHYLDSLMFLTRLKEAFGLVVNSLGSAPMTGLEQINLNIK